MSPCSSRFLFPRVASVAAFFVPLTVYWMTLAPSVTLEDSAEYASVAKVLGLAHPPGSPTWVLLAHTMNYIPIGTFVQRTNFLSSVCVSTAALLLFWLVRDHTRRWDCALAASGVMAFSQCIWGQAVVTYNYGLNLMMVLLALFLAGRWRLTSDPKFLAATALVGGLGAGVHHLFILISPVVLIWALTGKACEAFRPKVVLGCLFMLALGLCVFLYLPLRSSQDPPIAWGKVDSLQAFIRYLSRSVYKEAEGGIWYSGKGWDALQFLSAFIAGLPREQGGLLVFFSLPGAFVLFRLNRLFAATLFGVILLNVPVLLSMGGSQFTPTSEYINRLYYLPATAALAVFTAMGWAWLWSKAKGWSGIRPVILCAPLIPLALNWQTCDRSRYWLAREYLDNLLHSIPAGGAVFPLTNNETFLLLYARYVENNPKALLLDERFGWDGKPPGGGVLTAWNVGARAPHPVRPLFDGADTLPYTLLYRTFPVQPREGLERFRFVQPVECTTSHKPAEFPHLSPFERMIFASYSAYFASLGSKFHLEGETEGRDRAWCQAEELNPGDPYCHWLLGSMYKETGTQPLEAQQDHFEMALRLFDQVYDPLDTRFYGVTHEEIKQSVR
jgi:hypothetical protein